MPLTDYMEKNSLDWVCGGATPTTPVGRWVSFAASSPTSQSPSMAPASTESP